MNDNVRIFMPPAQEGWAGDVTTAEFRHHTRHTIVDSPAEADLIWLYSKWIHDRYNVQFLKTKPVITTVHHIVPEKGFDATTFDAFTDVYHVPNAITSRALSTFTAAPQALLPYWVPLAHGILPPNFRDPIGSFPRRVTERFIFGSFQRDTEGLGCDGPDPRPKLEKGPDILVGVCNQFHPNEFRLVLAGHRRQFIRSRLLAQSLQDLTAGKPDGRATSNHADISRLYNGLSIIGGTYLVTSRHEGGPQAILEAAISRCRILSTDVGIARDVLHPSCILRPEEFSQVLRSRGSDQWQETVDHNLRSAQCLHISSVIQRYDDLVSRVMRGCVGHPGVHSASIPNDQHPSQFQGPRSPSGAL